MLTNKFITNDPYTSQIFNIDLVQNPICKKKHLSEKEVKVKKTDIEYKKTVRALGKKDMNVYQSIISCIINTISEISIYIWKVSMFKEASFFSEFGYFAQELGFHNDKSYPYEP